MSFFDVGNSSLSQLNTEASFTNGFRQHQYTQSEGTSVLHQERTRHTHSHSTHTHSRHPVAAHLVPVPGTQEDADKVVATKYIQGLESAQWTDSTSYQQTKLADVPSNSTLGLWWQQYREALNNPNFVQWSKEVGLNVATLRLNPESGTLTGEFKGEKKQLILRDDVGWTEVADPILNAARVLAPPRRGSPVCLGSPDAGVPLEVVGNFYGESNADPATWRAQNRAVELKQLGNFAVIPDHDFARSQAVRGPQALAAQQQLLADIDDHHSVLKGLPDTSAQAKADRLLGARFAAELRKGPWEGDDLYQRRLGQIPEGSTFGQWWKLYRDAYQTPQFLDWAKAAGADISTVKVSPVRNEVSGTFNGKHQVRSFDNNKEWAHALAPIQSAGAAVATTRFSAAPSPVDYTDSSAPLRLVAAVHGYDVTGFDKEDAVSTAQEIEQNPTAFKNRDRGAILSTDALETQRLAIGNRHDKHNLIQGLNEVEKAVVSGSSNFSNVLERAILRVHPHSSYGQHHAAQPGHTVSVSQFIQGSGLNVPVNKAQLLNLRAVLGGSALKAPEHGNYWRMLTQPLLTRAQRQQVKSLNGSVLAGYGISAHEGIARLFATSVKTDGQQSPERLLTQLLSSPQAKAMGKFLEKKLNAKSTETSAADWAAAAMVLNLDPTAGTQRNRVAGYNLAKQSNWGLKPQAIVDGLTQHLIAQGKASAELAPAAGRLLLAGMAPEFLVTELPGNLAYGSHAWFSFSVAVARIEKLAPGASQSMTFKQVMAFGQTQPISVSEQAAQTGVQRDAIVDWGIINGFIAKRADGVYSNESVDLARRGFNQQRSALESASNAQQAAIPSHKELALAQLRARLGNDIDFEKKSIKHDDSFSLSRWASELPVSKQALTEKAAVRRSMLELYQSNNLNRADLKWVCTDPNVPFDRVMAEAKSLPDLTRLYKDKADGYSAQLKSSVALNIRNLIAQLPLEDRKNFEFGSPELYAVRGADHGLVIRTRRTSPPTDYELFPSQALLHKHTGLPDPLPLGRAGSTLALDFAAYQKGQKPQQGTSSPNVVFDRVPFSQVTAVGSSAADEPANADSTPRSFFTQHTKSFATVAASFFVSGFETLKEKSKATTDQEEKTKSDASIKDTLVRMIPFVAAAEDAKAGKYGAALTDLAFDAFGFLAPELKLVETGESALAKLGSREVESLASSSAEQSATSVVKMGDGAGEMSAAGHGINRQHVLSPSALEELALRRDVAVGSVNGTSMVAQYDEAAKQWYAYDVRAGKPYGPPLSDFTPEVSPAPNTTEAEPAVHSLLGNGLKRDNYIEMDSTMRDLKLIGPEIHTYTDTFKGVPRLNIVAHGKRTWLDRLLREPAVIAVDGVGYDAKGLVTLLKSKEVDPSKFDNVRLLICHSADGKGRSFASGFQKEINRPVEAFEGRVTLNAHGSTAITQRRMDLVREFEERYPQDAQVLADIKLKKELVNKVTVEVEKRHGNVIVMNTTKLGGVPKEARRKVVYKPRLFG